MVAEREVYYDSQLAAGLNHNSEEAENHSHEGHAFLGLREDCAHRFQIAGRCMRLAEACCRSPHYQLLLDSLDRQDATPAYRGQKARVCCSRDLGVGSGSWTSLQQPGNRSMFVSMRCGVHIAG